MGRGLRMKNIVICCDGTGNEYGERKSNVVKLYQCLHNVPGRQVTYYHPGVGTMGDMRALSEAGRAWTKFRGLAFGYGLSENIVDAYRFLMQTFEEKDAIYIFGFSRGAYTARALRHVANGGPSQSWKRGPDSVCHATLQEERRLAGEIQRLAKQI